MSLLCFRLKNGTHETGATIKDLILLALHLLLAQGDSQSARSFEKGAFV